MNPPKVSILINCYNSEQFLKEALDSAYAQTYTDWEIVLIDNCSTDRTAEIAKSYDSKLHYYRTEKLIPLGAARRYGHPYCSGEFLAFLDSDDRWLKDKLEKQIALMETTDYGFCYTGINEIDERGRIMNTMIPVPRSGYLFRDLLKNYDIRMLTVLANSKYIKQYSVEFDDNLTYSVDYNFFMKLALRCKALVIPDITADYRMHGSSLTEKSSHKWAEETIYTLRFLEQAAPEEMNKYPEEVDLAYSTATYLEAKHALYVGDRRKSLENLKLIRKKTSKFQFWYFLVLLTPIHLVWKMITKYKRKMKLLLYRIKMIGHSSIVF